MSFSCPGVVAYANNLATAKWTQTEKYYFVNDKYAVTDPNFIHQVFTKRRAEEKVKLESYKPIGSTSVPMRSTAQ